MKRLPFFVAALFFVPRVALAQDDAPPAPAPAPAAPAPPLPKELVPIGRAAPPTEAATRSDAHVRPGLEIFANYTYRDTKAQDGSSSWFHVFDVPRVHGAIEGEMDRVRGRVVLEATRSAADGALIGVAGDSLVLRVREAYAAWRPIDALDLEAGVVPTLTVPELDGTWMLRAIAPSAIENAGVLSPADVGVRARFELPKRYGYVATAVYNGEGYTNRELNRGKNTEFAAEIHPFPDGALLPLGVFGSFVGGSSGTGLARADRLTPGLVWQGARVRAGAFATWAWGVGDVGTQHAFVASVFARIEPIERFLVGARFDHVVTDTRAEPLDEADTLYGTLGYRVADPLEVFAAIARVIPTTRAESATPGSNVTALSAVVRVVF